jgi:protein pelota
VSDTKAAAEVAVLSTFLSLMASQPDRVTYGYGHVMAALEQGAMDKLLLSDNLFRARSVAKRRQYVGLVEAARAAGAAVHVFSSLHVSGEQLARLGGVAAVLRFPLPLEMEEEEEEEEEEEGQGGETGRG